MSDQETQVDVDDGAENPPEDAFSVLSHDLRLSVLEVLQERQEPGSFVGDPLSYSEILDELDVRDSGNFNYHLSTLEEGGFVERVDDGYRIRQAGVRVIRAIKAGNITDVGGFENVEIEEPCPYCGGTSAISLIDDWLFIRCRECPGAFAQEEYLPAGTIAGFEVSPAGVRDRSPEEIFRMAFTLGLRVHRLFAKDCCPDCGGTKSTRTLEICLDHDLDETRICDACGRTTDEFVAVSCDVCGRSLMTFPSIVVATDPHVVAVMYERGLDVTDRTWISLSKPPDWPARYVTREPVVVEYEIPVPDGEDIVVRLEEDLSIDVRNP